MSNNDFNNQKEWQPLSLDCLNKYEVSEDLYKQEQEIAIERKHIIQNTFEDFAVNAEVVDYIIGPRVTRYNIKCAHNTSVRAVSNIVTDIQVRMGGTPVMFKSIVYGQSLSAIEIENEKYHTVVPFKNVMEALPNYKEHPLAIPFGMSVNGKFISADLNQLPHLLIGGITGSGKSIFMNSVITSLIMRNSPEDLKLVLVDPDKVQYFRFKDMPHLLCPVLTEVEETKFVLEQLVEEMSKRYAAFHEIGCANIEEYNEDCVNYDWLKKKPYIVVVVDEYADVVDQDKTVSTPLITLAQKARCAGIHIILGTQRPSPNVITGVLKANIPSHISFTMASLVDSLTIIGEGGAERLLGRGDMLVQSHAISRANIVRLQGCFIHRYEINRVVDYLKNHYKTQYNPAFIYSKPIEVQVIKEEPKQHKEDELGEEDKYETIKKWVLTQDYMSISRIQRECSLGFNRAGRYFLRLQKDGIVSEEITKHGSLVIKKED